MLRLVATVAACTVIRCGSAFIGPESQPLPDAFAGSWRSVTPSFEFVRLSVFATTSGTCDIAARITFSGVAWEGSGQVAGDSLVMQMSAVGSATPKRTVVAHAGDERTLRVEMRPESGTPLDLIFVRDAR
jgi:hypothetical protein